MSDSRPTKNSSSTASPTNSDTSYDKTPQGETSGELDFIEQLMEFNTKIQSLEARLTKSKEQLVATQHQFDINRHILACYPHAFVCANNKLDVIYADDNFTKITGLTLQHLSKKRFFKDVLFFEPEQDKKALLQAAVDNGSWHGKVQLKTDQNVMTPMTMSLYYRGKGVPKPNITGFVCIFNPPAKEPTSQTAANGSLLANFSPTTDIPARSSCEQHLAKCIKQAQKDHSQFCVLNVCIDHLSRINRLRGPFVGDKVFSYAKSILKEYGEKTGADLTTVLSEDTFAIILPPPSSTEDADKLATKLLQKFQQTVAIKSHEILITLSIGISVYPNDGDNPLELLHSAYDALKKAKERGGNGKYHWGHKTGSSPGHKEQNIELENDLYQAISNSELINFYQPQISMQDGRVVGMEALARWYHPKHGHVSPGIFIPIAENMGLIDKLSNDLILLACKQGQEWLSMGYNFTMAVNISGSMVRHNDLFERIMGFLRDSGFSATSLELELTESMLVDNVKNAIELLDRCRQQGLKLAIDDFGTGYSSLSYLQRFAVDKLKIDRSFVTGVTTSENDAAITLAIIAMARKLGFQVLAEGIETEDQLMFLKENNCDICQGFLFSRPVSAEEMKHILIHDANVAMKHRRILDKFHSIRGH